MWYSSYAAFALIIQTIINQDILRNKYKQDQFPARREYRRFLLSLSVYYIIDTFWGTLYELRLIPVLWVVTTVYFASMAVSVFFWTRYVIAYLPKEKDFKKILFYVGWVFLLFESLVLILNCFTPIVFTFAEDKTYIPCKMRYVTLLVQVLMYFATALYTLRTAQQSKGKSRRRCRTVGISGLTLAVLIAGQALFPLLPLYSIGCVLGVCILHTFVVEDEKNDYRKELERSLQREKTQRSELESAQNIVETDPLTGVKSKYAYIKEIEKIEAQMDEGVLRDLCVMVFDLNDLKTVNDTKGHEEGDKYIRDACALICRRFSHSPVYRIGGDEFVALLRDDDFRNRRHLALTFDTQMEYNRSHNGIVIATGMEDYRPDTDQRFSEIFERADRLMYERKRYLKELPG